MKTKILSIMLAVILVLSVSLPVFAGEKTEKRTNLQIIDNIEKTYGIAFVLDEDNEYTEETPLRTHLLNIEKGLEQLGPELTQKIVDKYDFRVSRAKLQREKTMEAEDYEELAKDEWMEKFRIRLKVEVAPVVAGRVKPDYASYIGGEILVYANQAYPARIYGVVHEFGHALNGAAGRPFPDVFMNEKYTGNGKWNNKASEAPDRFASSYAETLIDEDYAETFALAIVNGADNPLTYGKDTIIYQKTRVVYDDLVAVAGKKALATKRVAGYLGI